MDLPFTGKQVQLNSNCDTTTRVAVLQVNLMKQTKKVAVTVISFYKVKGIDKLNTNYKQIIQTLQISECCPRIVLKQEIWQNLQRHQPYQQLLIYYEWSSDFQEITFPASIPLRNISGTVTTQFFFAVYINEDTHQNNSSIYIQVNDHMFWTHIHSLCMLIYKYCEQTYNILLITLKILSPI